MRAPKRCVIFHVANLRAEQTPLRRTKRASVEPVRSELRCSPSGAWTRRSTAFQTCTSARAASELGGLGAPHDRAGPCRKTLPRANGGEVFEKWVQLVEISVAVMMLHQAKCMRHEDA